MGKKQFPLVNKENCAIYLTRIISSCELCMDRYKKYNKETRIILDKYQSGDAIPYNIYGDICDKTCNIMSYLLNLLGDCQTTSVSELELIEKKKMDLPSNPMSIVHYNYMTYEYFMDLYEYESNLDFCSNARKIIQVAKKDYALLMGESISYPRVYSDKPITLEKSEPTKMSAQIQGLKGDNH